jgi:predicted component of type VI protein secretion system
MNKNKIRITENELKQIVAESVKKVLNESIKGVDKSNIVSQNKAEKYGFEREYSFGGNNLELWKGTLPKSKKEIKNLLINLGIKRFTSYNLMNYTCYITVAPDFKSNQVDKLRSSKAPNHLDLTYSTNNINNRK